MTGAGCDRWQELRDSFPSPLVRVRQSPPSPTWSRLTCLGSIRPLGWARGAWGVVSVLWGLQAPFESPIPTAGERWVSCLDQGKRYLRGGQKNSWGGARGDIYIIMYMKLYIVYNYVILYTHTHNLLLPFMFLRSLGREKSLWEDADFKTGSALLREPLANPVARGLVEGGGRLPGAETRLSQY